MELWNPPDQPVRVALIGAPLSGKSEILRAFARHQHVPLIDSEAGTPRTIVTSVAGPGYAAATYAGAVWSPDVWFGLIEWCTDALAVLDPQKAREPAVRRAIEDAEPWRAKVRAVQVTKMDIIARAPAQCFPAQSVAQVYGLGDLPPFFSSVSEPASVFQALARLLRVAAPVSEQREALER